MKKQKESKSKPKQKKCCTKELKEKIDKAVNLLNELTEDATIALNESDKLFEGLDNAGQDSK